MRKPENMTQFIVNSDGGIFFGKDDGSNRIKIYGT